MTKLNFQLPLSGSLQADLKALEESEKAVTTFNSLSRDHPSAQRALGSRDRLSTPSLGITLSTRSEATRSPANGFQLPLSGSHDHSISQIGPERLKLSTPSLGITGDRKRRLPNARDDRLSTPSLGITKIYSPGPHLARRLSLSTPSLGITHPTYISRNLSLAAFNSLSRDHMCFSFCLLRGEAK